MHKNQAFLNKKTWKNFLPGQKTSKNIVPRLEPEKVENHCYRGLSEREE